jgi:hypothetical protein
VSRLVPAPSLSALAADERVRRYLGRLAGHVSGDAATPG